MIEALITITVLEKVIFGTLKIIQFKKRGTQTAREYIDRKKTKSDLKNGFKSFNEYRIEE